MIMEIKGCLQDRRTKDTVLGLTRTDHETLMGNKKEEKLESFTRLNYSDSGTIN